MGYKRGIDTFNLIMTDKIAHTEFIGNDDYILQVTGINLNEEKGDVTDIRLTKDMALAKKLDYDFMWNTYEVPITGRLTNMGHAVWDALDKKDTNICCPFKSKIKDLIFSSFLSSR